MGLKELAIKYKKSRLSIDLESVFQLMADNFELLILR